MISNCKKTWNSDNFKKKISKNEKLKTRFHQWKIPVMKKHEWGRLKLFVHSPEHDHHDNSLNTPSVLPTPPVNIHRLRGHSAVNWLDWMTSPSQHEAALFFAHGQAFLQKQFAKTLKTEAKISVLPKKTLQSPLSSLPPPSPLPHILWKKVAFLCSSSFYQQQLHLTRLLMVHFSKGCKISKLMTI